MAATFTTSDNLIDRQIAALQSERRIYSRRINELLANRGERSAELNGYLRLVDDINAAVSRIAQGAMEPDESAA